MMHPFLAIRAFFAALFGRNKAPLLLAAPDLDLEADLDAATLKVYLERTRDALSSSLSYIAELERGAPKAAPEAAQGLLSEPEPSKAPAPAAEAAPKVNVEAIASSGAIQLLALMQSEGKLIDFLMEDIDGYGDEDVGAAVREIHRGCKKALLEHFELAPVRSEDEESRVMVEAGFDPEAIRLVGNLSGTPPFAGVLRHKGWLSEKSSLPKLPKSLELRIIQAAEVEL